MTAVVYISPIEHELAKLMVEYGPKWGYEVPQAVETMALAAQAEPDTATGGSVVLMDGPEQPDGDEPYAPVLATLSRRVSSRDDELAAETGQPVSPAVEAMIKAAQARRPRSKEEAAEDLARSWERAAKMAERLRDAASGLQFASFQDDNGKTWVIPLVSSSTIGRTADSVDELQDTSRESGPTVSAAPSSSQRMTERELQVLRLLVAGATKQEIAQQLDIANSTVAVLLKRIGKRLGAEPFSQIRESDPTRQS